MMGELAGRLLDPFIPPGHVMDQDDAGPRSAAERPRVIGFAHISLVAAKGDRLREHTFVGHAVPHQLDGRSHAYTQPRRGLGVQMRPPLARRVWWAVT